MRGRIGGTLFFVTLVSLSGVACGSNGCNPATGELRFIDNSQSVALVVGAVGARTVNSVDLGPVPNLPLLGNPSLNSVDLIGQNESLAPINNQGLPGQQIEAQLFVADLVDLNNYLSGVGAAEPIQEWDDRTGLGNLGQDVVIPFPPNANWNTSNRYRVSFLFPVVFWPNTPPLDPADFPNPPGYGSMKSVRFYKPGICGLEISFTNSNAPGINNASIFDTISDTFYQKFATSDKIDGGSAVRAWSRVTTLLDDGLDIFGPKGGFFWYFWFTATAGNGYQDVNFAANYEYDFTLNDGRVALTPVRNDILVQPQSAFGGFKDALENQLPQSLNQLFVQSQKKPFLRCSGDNGTDPSASIGLVGGIAAAGGQKLGLSAGDQARLQSAIGQANNWSCDPDGNGNMVANFILRAKRINVYPDAIELVWFDDQNPDDPMFALYAAASTTGGANALCARPRTIVDGVQNQYVKRTIITVSR